MLKILAIFFGLLIIVSRGLIALSPGQFRKVAANFAGNKSILRGMGVFVLVLSILIYIALDNDISGARAMMAVFGVVSFLGGLWLLALPAQYTELLDMFLKFPDGAIRVIAGIGVVMGILIVALGIAYY